MCCIENSMETRRMATMATMITRQNKIALPRCLRLMRRKQRGSAILFCLVIIVAIVAILLVSMEFSMQHMRNELHYERDRIVDYSWEGVVETVDADIGKSPI